MEYILHSHEPDCSLSYSGFFCIYDLGVSYTFHLCKRDDWIIRNIFTEWCFDPWLKREQGGWCNLFWEKDSKEKNKELLGKVPLKIHGSYGKNKNIVWFVNNSEYPQKWVSVFLLRGKSERIETKALIILQIILMYKVIQLWCVKQYSKSFFLFFIILYSVESALSILWCISTKNYEFEKCVKRNSKYVQARLE